ncbi:MAG: hypothetical protein Q7U63_14255 [Polaromonas sp.]|jgi:hypothetical protein|uniref:DUF5983 family protein n=1 Tax=Polaromonas sp. TaxID=1869339 RepID=UPI0027292ABD|nr:hypothetical protein [Polaromonas sp.]MDO9114942.1 hypothetical protein [Polaromonas sp.]MDO9201551.1 hypothetical protein [Hydrogenophaga sp.]
MQSHPTTFTMLDLSTAHLKPETRSLLTQDLVDGALIYPKGPWGWFVHVPTEDDGLTIGDEVPADLKACIQYAQQLQQNWLMLDNDGTVASDLPVYGDVEEAPVAIAVATPPSGQQVARTYAQQATSTPIRVPAQAAHTPRPD